MKNLPLTKIGFFNPSRLSDEDIERSFISRIPFFEFLLKKITDEPAGSIPQHFLVIGQRGMGKTMLLVRIAAEIRKQPYRKKFIPLSFPEEQYNIDRLSKFWLNCLDSLADALDKENDTQYATSLDAEIRAISSGPDIDAIKVYEKFKEWSGKLKRRPVLLVDNLNLIFSKLVKEEQHQLRAILISNGAPILVGASSSSIDETVEYGAPFYDGFQINYLKKLSFGESLEVLLNLGRITGTPDFEAHVHRKKARLKAIYQLTGGTPRTIAILFPLIQDKFSENIQTDLDALLDVITPLYKARFEELSPQSQVVMDAVALNWDPVSIEQLRNITQLENHQLSPLLKRLVDLGWLQKLEGYKTKGAAYEVSERFFNVWYLMRRSSRRQKRELYWLTKFLESFYGSEISELAKSRITCKSENINHIALDLALADAIKDATISSKLRYKGYSRLIQLSLEDDEILKEFTIPATVAEQHYKDLILNADTLYTEGKYPEAINEFKKALNLDAGSEVAWSNLGLLYIKVQDYEKADSALKKSLEVKDNKLAYYNLGHLYQNYLLDYVKAEDYLHKAIAIDDAMPEAWHSLALLYTDKLEKFEAAEESYKKTIKLTPGDSVVWGRLGSLYVRKLKQFEKGEHAFLESIRIDDTNLEALYEFAGLYHYHLGRFEEAEKLYKRVIELDGSDQIAKLELGNLYRDKLGKYNEAEALYLEVINKNSDLAETWTSLGNLYHNKIGDYGKAESAYGSALNENDKYAPALMNLGFLYANNLGKFGEAERIFKTLVEINKDLDYAWFMLGNLYSNELENFVLAEDAFRKSIAINDRHPFTWQGLGDLYRDKLHNYKGAEEAYKAVLDINPDHLWAWNNLGTLYHDYLGNYGEAEKAYQRAIILAPDETCSKLNLVFLLRDQMSRKKEARELFETIVIEEDYADSYYLNGALFEFYENNIGRAEAFIEDALKIIGEKLPVITQDDWFRAAAVIIKLGHAEHFLKVLQSKGYDKILRPYYVAIEAMLSGDEELFFNSIASEVREPARKIIEMIKTYNA
jgi:tetratricopeptide (TPR) repeat protein